MKLATAVSLIALTVGGVAFGLTAACGGDEDSSSSSSSGGAGAGRTPPGPPSAGATTASDERVFAVNKLYLGETDRNGAPVKDKAGANIAWKDYGFDIDGKISAVENQASPALKELCDRQSGAPATVHQDGTEGIDNSFGKEILKLLEPFSQTPSASINENIAEGTFTVLLKVKGLTDDAKQSNTGLTGELLVGAKFSDAGTPTFTQADMWPFRAEPKIQLPDAYINNGTFVNGTSGAKISIKIDIAGQSLSLTINRGVITFKHQPGNDIVDGTISGILNTEEFITGVSAIAGTFSPDLCKGSTIEGIKQSIRQASDIMTDGSNRAGVKCDGISIGLGFTGKRVSLGGPVTDTGPSTNPCDSDGGM